jgi:hypothetical protein
MSGRRTKQLRKECARRLGRAPFDADGHVTARSAVVQSGGFFYRVMQLLKRKPVVQIDEFRYFKRHRCTPDEAAARRLEEIRKHARHEMEVELNNERMGVAA